MAVAAVGAAGNATITINTAAFVGTLNFEASDDGGTTYYPLSAAREDATGQDSTVVYTITALYQRIWIVGLAGVTYFRVRCSAFTSGTAAIRITAGPMMVEPNPIATMVPTDGNKTTYAASSNFSPVATAAQDIFTLTGSATRLVKLLRVEAQFWATTAAAITAGGLVKRSTANSGGTSAAVTAIPLDANNVAATATALSYSVNPTAGTALGNIRSLKLAVPLNTSPPAAITWDFGTRPGQALALRGTAQVIALNLGGASVTGISASVTFEWTEETY
jgi:hypothetical protein